VYGGGFPANFDGVKMEPAIPDLRAVPREQAYAQLRELQHLVLDGSDDVIAGMATISTLLHHAFGHLWTGFYRVVEADQTLRVGPYQGSLGCLDIAFGRGVCGTAAASRATVVVADVHEFPGHITCDPRSRSEIVVPVFDGTGALIAVLDIDSPVPNAFTDVDRAGLEAMVAWFAKSTYVPVPA
jgi:GAF domain-containing protein